MKKLIAPLFVLFLLASAFVPAKKGSLYTSPDAAFSVVFPASFTVDKTQGESYVTTKIMGEAEGINYMASSTIHETDLSTTDNLEQVSLEAFAERLSGNVLSTSSYKFKNIVGLKANIISEANNMEMEYIVVIDGNIQYQFIVFTNISEYNAKAAKSFFKSISFN